MPYRLNKKIKKKKKNATEGNRHLGSCCHLHGVSGDIFCSWCPLLLKRAARGPTHLAWANQPREWQAESCWAGGTPQWCNEDLDCALPYLLLNSQNLGYCLGIHYWLHIFKDENKLNTQINELWLDKMINIWIFTIIYHLFLRVLFPVCSSLYLSKVNLFSVRVVPPLLFPPSEISVFDKLVLWAFVVEKRERDWRKWKELKVMVNWLKCSPLYSSWALLPHPNHLGGSLTQRSMAKPSSLWKLFYIPQIYICIVVDRNHWIKAKKSK